jgi:membrane associated rhomboid family serine protease
MSNDEGTASAVTIPTRVPKRSDFRQYPMLVACGGIAVAVTIAWGSGADVSSLVESAGIRRGELWRLLASAFLHVNVVHLLFNLYWPWEFGQPVERHFGHAKTAALLALLAIVSGAFEFAFVRGGVGLSGVVYGLFGLLWVLSRHDDRFRATISRSTILLFVAWFGFCIVATEAKIYQIGNVAHGSGFVVGILIGFAISRRSGLIAAGTGLLVLVGLWGATLGRPMVNLSRTAGYEEARWGYDALMAHQDQAALSWLCAAARLQPESDAVWFNLGIVYKRLGDDAASKAAYERAHILAAKDTKPGDGQK